MLSGHKTSLFKVAYFLFFDRLIQARVKNCIITVKGSDIGNVFLPTIPSIFEQCYFAFPCIIPYHSLLGSTQLLSLGYSIENRTCKFSSASGFPFAHKNKLTRNCEYIFAVQDVLDKVEIGDLKHVRYFCIHEQVIWRYCRH